MFQLTVILSPGLIVNISASDKRDKELTVWEEFTSALGGLISPLLTTFFDESINRPRHKWRSE